MAATKKLVAWLLAAFAVIATLLMAAGSAFAFDGLAVGGTALSDGTQEPQPSYRQVDFDQMYAEGKLTLPSDVAATALEDDGGLLLEGSAEALGAERVVFADDFAFADDALAAAPADGTVGVHHDGAGFHEDVQKSFPQSLQIDFLTCGDDEEAHLVGDLMAFHDGSAEEIGRAHV